MDSRNWRTLIAPLLLIHVLYIFTIVLADHTTGVKARSTEKIITIPMPEPPLGGPKHNNYMCTSVSLARDDRYIVQYEPRADPTVAHHMLMFGCQGELPKLPHSSWMCKSNSMICGGGQPKVLYAWALNASGLQLPDGVGMQIGPSVSIHRLVIQIHYGHPETVPDLDATSKVALLLHTTQQSQPYVAGIYLLGSSSSIRSGQERVFVDGACKFPGPKPIFPFAFRTHAHSLGEQIVGYIVKQSGEWELIGTRSPQDAQAFYPATSDTLEVDEGDWLALRCVFNTKGKSHTIRMGPDSEDEMCNFYIMYYTANDGHGLRRDTCWDRAPHGLRYPDHLPPLPAITSPVEEDHDHTHHHDGGNNEGVGNKEGDDEEDEYICPKTIPPGNPSLCPKPTPQIPIPTNPSTTTDSSWITREEVSPSTGVPFFEGVGNQQPVDLGLVQAENWVLNDVSIPGTTLGQVSAVAVDNEGNVHILHRGHVVWDYRSFNRDDTYRHQSNVPISEPTLLKFTSTGSPLYAWGEKLFYLPHGLTIDPQGAFWVTDVALHQVFKFSKPGDKIAAMILGTKFKPGVDFGHFCKPTSVAVEESGVFYIADGYCNQRILKFDSTGTLLETWKTPIEHIHLFVPHKLALSADDATLFVADRENNRVISYDISKGVGEVFSGPKTLRSSVYSISLNGSNNWPMYGVFGGNPGSMGFTLDNKGARIATWGPKHGFAKPHDLAVDSLNGAVYVTEIGPNRIWKFVSLAANSAVPLPDKQTVPPTTQPVSTSASQDTSSSHAPPITSHPPHTDPPLVDATTHHSQSPPDTPHTDPPLVDATTHHSQSPPDTPHTVSPPLIDGVLPDSPLTGPGNESETQTAVNSGPTDNALAAGASDDTVIQQATFNFGIFIAIFVVVVLVLIVVFGILREHKYLKKLRNYVKLRRKTAGAIEGGGVAVETRGKSPQKTLQSLLGPSQLGFSRLKTYDSDSEAEEFPVFNRV